MADNVVDKEIVDLPEATGVTGDTVFPGYVPGALNPAQKITAEQLKEYFGQEVFVATYGVTAPEDVEAAYTAGKLVFCDYNGTIAATARPSTTHFIFAAINGDTSINALLNRSTGEWVNADHTIESRNFKTNVISSDSKDYQYPSAKAVYEFGQSLVIEGGGGGGLPGADGEDGGYYIPNVTQPDQYTMQVDFTASKDGMAQVPPINIDLPEGPRGPAGSDASVTAENISAALGYAPVGATTVNQLLDNKVDVNPQPLSKPQQTQARENIGAASVDDIKWENLPDKPFGGSYETVYGETTVTINSDDWVELPNFPEIYYAKTYVIVVDGIEYKTVAGDPDGEVAVTLGHPDLTEPSNCPLYIVQYSPDEGNTGLYNAPPGTYTFSILQSDVKTIDEVYIPDTIARKTDIPEHTWESLPDKPFSLVHTIILAETEMAPDSYDAEGNAEYNPVPLTMSVVEGETYILIVDGVEYKTVAMTDEMGDTYLGYEGYTTPDTLPIDFICFVDAENGPMAYLRGGQSGTYNVAIYKDDKKIEESALPYTTEEWTFMLNDGSTVTKQVVVK